MAPGGGSSQAPADATVCPGRRLLACPGPSHARQLRPRMLHFATSPCFCAFRAGTEHQVRGGDGREPDGPAPSSFQHQAGRKVNPSPPAPAKFEPGKPECAFPLLARVASSLSHAHMGSGCKCRLPSSFCVLLFLSPLNQSGVPQQGTLTRITSPGWLQRLQNVKGPDGALEMCSSDYILQIGKPMSEVCK